MQISNLTERPDLISQLVDHLWSEWSVDYMMLTRYKTHESLTEYYREMKSEMPICYVVHHDNVFIGSCTIDVEDMGVHPELSPWLASVYVVPEHRNQGVAHTLLTHVVAKYPLLYLWTFNDGLAHYYERFGFKTQEKIVKHGDHHNIVFMCRKLLD